MLNDRQIYALTLLRDGPLSTDTIYKQTTKKMKYASISSTHHAMRRLEDRGLVRMRVRSGEIVWEKTAAGTKALKAVK